MRHQEAISLILRFLAYAATVAGIFEALVLAVAGHGGHWVMRDDGPVELVQLAAAFLTAVGFWMLSRRRPRSADLFRVFSALSLMACARELDNFTLQLGWREGYLVLAAFPLAWALTVLARARARFFDQLAEFARTPSFALLMAGFLIVVVFAQLLGQKALWMSVLGADVYRPVKEIVEESCELLGYLLMLFGAAEAAAFPQAD